LIEKRHSAAFLLLIAEFRVGVVSQHIHLPPLAVCLAIRPVVKHGAPPLQHNGCEVRLGHTTES
jgi:hypothetical protein